jgi:hypothetical protein
MTDSKIIQPLGDGKKKILSLDEAMKQVDAYRATTNHHTPNEPVNYLGLEWEPTVPRSPDTNHKQILTFDKSLRRLREAGYERHPRTIEYFSLIIDYFNGELADKPDLEAVAKDILHDVGEWASMVMIRVSVGVVVGGRLYCYTDPETITWRDDGRGYWKSEAWGENQNEFDMEKIVAKIFTDAKATGQQDVYLDDCSDEFVEFLYGRTCQELPARMRSRGVFRARIQLPLEDDGIHPVKIILNPPARGYQLELCERAASRGVRVKTK